MTCQLDLMLSAGDTPASHSAWPGSKEAQRMTATSGRKCSAYYRRSGPVGSFARMFMAMCPWDSTKCYLTWKVKATPRNHLLFQLAPSMPRTEGTDSGLLPTKTASSYGTQKSREGNRSRPSLETMARTGLIHTPTATANQASPSMVEKGSGWWTTPTTMDYLPPRSPEALKRLAEGVRKGRTRPGTLREQTNPESCRMWPTPTHQECRNGYQNRDRGKKGTQKSLTTVVIDEMGGRKAVSGQLNPQWVEWLMGYPVGWTDLKD